MGDILFLVLRRLRAPLITLILIYAVSIAGLVAIPGVDAQGQALRMSYFHAFYIISYTATTIGFGEIPFPFTDAQRLWITAVIYVSVIGWAYALGSVFNLSRDPSFRAAAARSLFVQRVRRLREPYCVVCGYGRSGREVVQALDQLGVRVVLVEVNPERVAMVEVQPFSRLPIVLVGDARRPETLRDAGIAKPECRAVIALTQDDETNQTIAIGARVLDPLTRVIARVSDLRIQENLNEFGGVQVIDPVARFAQVLQASMTSPAAMQVEQRLTSAPGTPRRLAADLPRGHWVLAGDARFIQPVLRAILATGQTANASPGQVSEEDLRQAGIDHAVGLVSCAASDADNVGIVSLARRLRGDLVVVIRQNKAFNEALIETARPTLTFRQSGIVTPEVLRSLTTPLLARGLALLRTLPEDQVERIAARIEEVSATHSPWVWTCDIEPGLPTLRTLDARQAHGIRIGELLCDPREPMRRLPMAALAVLRAASSEIDGSGSETNSAVRTAPRSRLSPLGRWIRAPLQVRARTGLNALGRTGTQADVDQPSGTSLRWLPADELELSAGDQVLFLGAEDFQSLQQRVLTDPTIIEHRRSGREPPRSAVFRWLATRRRH
ncbi:MAG: NAD-binding protein [Burkholderiaceae bacterium]